MPDVRAESGAAEEAGNGFMFELIPIIESFMVRFEEEGGKAMASRPRGSNGGQSESCRAFNGQFVGFFEILETFLIAAARNMGRCLDEITDEDLLRKANAGLGFDEAAYNAHCYETEMHAFKLRIAARAVKAGIEIARTSAINSA